MLLYYIRYSSSKASNLSFTAGFVHNMVNLIGALLERFLAVFNLSFLYVRNTSAFYWLPVESDTL